MRDWPDIERWRSALRKTLIAERRCISAAYRRVAQESIRTRLLTEFRELDDAAIGFFWPIRGEVDLRPMIRDLISLGAEAALPVVTKKGHLLEYWEWHASATMTRGIGNIPEPRTRKIIQPTVLLVPLLGFDPAGHRLGYGAGYFDRTLASFRLAPLTVGVGFDAAELRTIYPQPHDVPLDAIVTETRCLRATRRSAQNAHSSPPCFLKEFDE